jgi:CDP-6-deoxy-D-xylo-4-hexulose-3-dehydrase
LKLRFVDIDRETLNFDLAALERALDDTVDVVFAVNLLGNPNQFDVIRRLLAGRAVALIEDNCESMGATFAGRAAGTFGRIGTFSTFFSHHISTMEGGVCVTDDDELFHILLALRAHGWTRGLPWPNRVVEKDPRGDFHEAFRFVLPGYNVRPLEISGAIGLEQLKRLPGFIARRRDNARCLRDRVAALRGVRMQTEIGESSWMGFALILDQDTRASRDEVVARLQSLGVESRPIVAGNFAHQPVLAHLSHEPTGLLPGAEEIHQRGFYIGNNPMDEDLLDRLHLSLKTALG